MKTLQKEIKNNSIEFENTITKETLDNALEVIRDEIHICFAPIQIYCELLIAETFGNLNSVQKVKLKQMKTYVEKAHFRTSQLNCEELLNQTITSKHEKYIQ